jgi:apolipoprotein N-acyltransferase
MQTYGGLSPVVAVLVALLLASYLALYIGVFALLLGQAIRQLGVGGVWVAPACWVATEWLRATIGGGFPWVLLGSSQATVVPIVQAASVVGVYGLSALVALVSTAAAAVGLSRQPAHWRAALFVAAALAAVAGGGLYRISRGSWTSRGEAIRVGLVQGSVNQEDKYDANLREAILRRYVDLSRQAIGAGANLVIWPEASTPFYLDLDAAQAAPIRRLAVEARTPFIIGSDEFTAATTAHPDRYYNAAVLVGADGRSRSSYRKMQLVPFGEYVPLKRLLFFVGPLIEAVSDFSPGEEPVVFDVDGRRMSVAICYESVYPWIAREFVARGSQLLVTITNDAWFRWSSAAYQHFDQGMLRAVEEGRYLVRAANTGISGAVDPYGRVLVRTELFVPTVVTADVSLISARTIYSRLGDVVVWASFGVTLATIALGWRRMR